jgi:hypothetical protein
LLLFTGLPDWLNSHFGWNVAIGFGLGEYSFVLGICIIWGVSILFADFSENEHRQKPPRCCRKNVTTNGYEYRYVIVVSRDITQ